MSDVSVNPQLLISGFLRQAKAQADPVAWLTERHGEVLLAVAGGDTFVTSHGFSGQSGTEERNIPAVTLLQIYEACLQNLEAESAAASGVFNGRGSVRYADFSSYPCTLG